MSHYTRLFLHFLHAVTDARKRVHTFLFGTRLTNVTRALKAKDPDEALAAAARRASPTGRAARASRPRCTAFNKQWSRRVLAQGAIVLLITDGLERDRRRPAGVRDRPAAPLLPAADLAQPAAALRRLRGQGQGHPRHAAACRRIPADPQSRVDGRPGAGRCRPADGRGVAASGVRRPRSCGLSRNRRQSKLLRRCRSTGTTEAIMDLGARRGHPQGGRGLAQGRPRRGARHRGRDLGLGAAAGRLQPGDRRRGQFPRLGLGRLRRRRGGDRGAST